MFFPPNWNKCYEIIFNSNYFPGKVKKKIKLLRGVSEGYGLFSGKKRAHRGPEIICHRAELPFENNLFPSASSFYVSLIGICDKGCFW